MSVLLWQEQARAKINLGLKVLCRRQDGYHNISSIMQTVDLADQLHFFSAAENRLTTDDPQLSAGPDNLVWRAVELFARHCCHVLVVTVSIVSTRVKLPKWLCVQLFYCVGKCSHVSSVVHMRDAFSCRFSIFECVTSYTVVPHLS